jgi:hypothetical protein
MKTTTKEKAVGVFDAGAIEFAVTSSIKKNTLPEIRDSWKNWLDSYNAANLETDQDFVDAAKFVTECERTEAKLEEIREKALKGEVSKVIKEIETMKETTRQKRLEFNRAVTTRRDKLKTDAVASALKQLADTLAEFPHRRQPRNASEQPEWLLTASIKGKSSILKMQEALEQESARIVAEAKEYSATFTAMLVKVYDLYEAAGETATDSELDLLVSKYLTDAPERATLILQQKKVAREQAEIELRKQEQEDAKARAAQTEPASVTLPEPMPAAALPEQPPVAVPVASSAPVKTMVFTAVFATSRPIKVAADIAALGGQNVTFEEAN